MHMTRAHLVVFVSVQLALFHKDGTDESLMISSGKMTFNDGLHL